MSRGQLARTPENFPRMKDRARGREIRKQHRAAERFIENYPAFLAAMTAASVALSDALGSMISSVVSAMSPDLREHLGGLIIEPTPPRLPRLEARDLERLGERITYAELDGIPQELDR